MKRLLIAALVVFGFAATTRAEEPREVTVFAAASLREAFEDLAKTFESKSSVKVRVNLAGSQELRTQIENGARADVFASACGAPPGMRSVVACWRFSSSLSSRCSSPAARPTGWPGFATRSRCPHCS